MEYTVNMAIRGKISAQNKAYIAGLFDGEGHIFITEDMRPNYKTSLHILRIGVTNTHKPTIEWLFSLFPTTISKRVQHKNHPTWKPCYSWNAASKNALLFLKTIYPYLKIKKEQVRLGIEFQEQWQDRRLRDKKGRVQKTTDDVHKKRQWYKITISELNKKKS